MSLVDRVRAIVLTPNRAWPPVAAEPTRPSELVTGYLAPLAVIGPLATFVGLSIIGISLPWVGTVRTPIASALLEAALTFVFVVLGALVVAAIVNALAPSFSGRRNFAQALKVVVYSYTPALVAGAVLVFPVLAPLQLLAAAYGLCLLYLGLPTLMGTPREKALGYTASVAVCAIVAGLLLVPVVGLLRLSTLAVGGSYGLVPSAGSPDEARAKQVAAAVVGRLIGGDAAAQKQAQDLVDSVAQAGKAAATTQTSDPGTQAQAGLNLMKSLITGGKSVQVVPRQALQGALPSALPDLSRGETSSKSESFAGIKAAGASTSFSDGRGGTISVAVGDLGNMGGLATVAAIGLNLAESESDTGFDKNVEIDGHKVHEHWVNRGKEGELFAIVRNRFAVQVTSQGVELGRAVDALHSVDFGKLEALATASGDSTGK